MHACMYGWMDVCLYLRRSQKAVISDARRRKDEKEVWQIWSWAMFNSTL